MEPISRIINLCQIKHQISEGSLLCVDGNLFLSKEILAPDMDKIIYYLDQNREILHKDIQMLIDRYNSSDENHEECARILFSLSFYDWDILSVWIERSIFILHKGISNVKDLLCQGGEDSPNLNNIIYIYPLSLQILPEEDRWGYQIDEIDVWVSQFQDEDGDQTCICTDKDIIPIDDAYGFSPNDYLNGSSYRERYTTDNVPIQETQHTIWKISIPY